MTNPSTVATRINPNRITNSLISRLTLDDINNLGLLNIGITVYRGNLKNRVKGVHRTVVSNHYVVFENDSTRFEFIKLPELESTYAMRIFDKDDGIYDTYPHVLVGIDFFI